MRLTKRGEYALRAMIDLGLAREAGRSLLRLGELARKENIPVKFLEQIMVELKAAGYVQSKRGKNGGYFLNQPMHSIRMGDVVRSIEGPLAPIPCVSQTAYQRCSCPDESHCGLRMLMLDVRNAISNILDRYTLAQTVEVTLRKMKKDKAPMPFARGEKEAA
jgi:Rrf2 family protein